MTVTTLNWLDIIFAIILLISMAMSLRRGFTREVVGLVTSALALILGMWFYADAGAFVESWVGSRSAANLVGFFLVAGSVVLLGAIIGRMVSRFLSTVGLSLADRLLGGAFGLIRGLLLSIALLTAVTSFGPFLSGGSAPDVVVHSQLAPWLLEASRLGVAIAPPELRQRFRRYYGQTTQLWRQRAVRKAD